MCSKFFPCRRSYQGNVQTSLKRFLRTLRQQCSWIMSLWKRNCSVSFCFNLLSHEYRTWNGCRDRCWRMCLAINLQQAASSCHIKTFSNFPHKSTAIVRGVSETIEATHFKFNAAIPLNRYRLANPLERSSLWKVFLSPFQKAIMEINVVEKKVSSENLSLKRLWVVGCGGYFKATPKKEKAAYLKTNESVWKVERTKS